MFLNIGFRSNNQSYQSFGHTDRLKDIKRVPGVTCAICGKKVIMEDAVEKAYQAVTKPLAIILKKGYMDKWKEKPLIWEILNVYARIHPKKSLDKIVQRDEEFMILKKAVVKDVTDRNHTEGKDNESRKEILNIYNSIIQDSRKELRSASIVLDHFSKFKKYLFGNKVNVFEQLEIYAQNNPRKRLVELINTPECVEYHAKRQSGHKKQINMMREFHFNNIEAILKKVDSSAIVDAKIAKESVLNLFYTERDDAIKIYKAKKIYENIIEKYNCQRLKNKIFKELEQIPTTHFSMDSFFLSAQAKKYNDFAIINSIIAPFLSSFDHLIARSIGGKDSISNGTVLHQECNKNKANATCLEVLEYHPEYDKNSKKQIKYISRCLLKGGILSDDFRYWPLKIADTFRACTNKKINPNVNDYCHARLKAIVDKLHSDDILVLADANRQSKKFNKYLAEHEKDPT